MSRDSSRRTRSSAASCRLFSGVEAHVNDADPNTPITVRIRDDTGSLLAALYLSPEGAEGLHAELDAALLELDPNWHRHLAEKSEG